jgi:phosphopentomutase
VYGRLHPLGPGKDSISGHWELTGVVCERPLPTYPDGFPPELLAELERVTGRELICNRPANGIAAIERFGAEHLRTGALILYTSQDSVLQLAAHVERVPVDELYGACEAARAVMRGEHAVGRVIARPFSGEPGAFARTDGRRDFALAPSSRSYLEELGDAGVEVHAVGKVGQLFAGVGIDTQHPGATNARALAETTDLIRSLDAGFVFTNLVETDQVYGHRHDVVGFHGALREIDAAVAEWMALLRPTDMLVLTADHGCDPISPRTDHTREYAPVLAAFEGHGSRRHDGSLADVGASVLAWLAAGAAGQLAGGPAGQLAGAAGQRAGGRASHLPGESFIAVGVGD